MKHKLLKSVFSALIAIFLITLTYFIIPSTSFKRSLFPVMAALAFAFCFLGIFLIVLTIKQRVQGALRWFLILTGVFSTGFLICVFLHNLFYGIGIIASNIMVLKFIMEILHVVFFITAVIICPIGFLVGIIGSIILFIKER